MKRASFAFLACGLAATLIGCGGSDDSATPAPEDTSSVSTSSEFTLVTLKVPNMT